MVCRKMWRMAGLLVIVGILLAVVGCSLALDVGVLRRESRSVESGGAEGVRAEIYMGAGGLEVSGGGEDLLDAVFEYNVAAWRPEVSYSVDSGRGRLSVRQPSTAGVPTGDVQYTWDLRFNDDVPLELSVNLGAGDAELRLGDMSLGELDVQVGAGRLTLDLSGGWRDDLDANIQGGVGQAILRLPRDVGVRVEIRGGLGRINVDGMRQEGDAYVNDAYGRSEVTLYIRVEAGVGEVDLQLFP